MWFFMVPLLKLINKKSMLACAFMLYNTLKLKFKYAFFSGSY